jgi:phage tail-like protein
MPRRRVDDFLQSHLFWLMDVEPTIVPPNLVFQARSAFSAVSSPEISLEMTEVRDGNSPWVRKVVGKANAGPMTLQRGVQFHDDDFWQWITDALVGARSPRKTLALFHVHKLTKNVAPEAAFLTPGDWATGRLFVLFGVLPVRYKAGSDFDATDASISIQELEIAVERIEEINLASKR